MDCFYLSHGIHIEKDEIRDCCVRRGEEQLGLPFVMKVEDVENFDYDKLFSLKKSLKKEKIENDKKCKGCLHLSENENYDEDDEVISFLNFNHWNKCNSRCIYCSEQYNNGSFYYNILPFVKGLLKTGKFDFRGEVAFQGGEPTLLPEFEELLTLFTENNVKMRIHSSGIKYSQAIENGVKRGLVSVIISPDSGRIETYEKIKRVKQFDTVWGNIKRYSLVNTADNVLAKMIIIPGVNDTFEEVDIFLNKVLDSNIKDAVVDVEAWYGGVYNYNLPNVRFLMEYMKYRCEKLGLSLFFYDFAQNVECCTEKPDFPTEEREMKKEYEKLYQKYSNRKMKYY